MPDPDGLVHRVRDFARSGGLFRPGRVVVAVSGGQDSVSMLDILRRTAPELRIELQVAHLNHGFRGAQAAEEAEFVRRLAAGWGLPVEVGAIDVPAYRARHRLSKLEAARHARYQFLVRVAASSGADHVAVGHTADDSAETLLLSLLRGAGLAGLSGLPAARRIQAGQLGPSLLPSDWQSPELSSVSSQLPGIVRPILCLSRAETRAYCLARDLPYRSDPSNLDRSYHRNWIREELMPLLEARFPHASEKLSAAAELLADDWRIVDAVVDSLWAQCVTEATGRVEIDLRAWAGLEPPLQRHLLRRAIARVAGNLSEIGRVHLDSSLRLLRDSHAGARIDLPGRLYLEKGYNSFLLAREATSIAGRHGLPEDGILLAVPGRTGLPDGSIEAELREVVPGNHPARLGSRFEACLDADLAGPSLVVRSRRPGDSFVPLGMAESKKLQDFLVDQKVPRAERDSVPMVASPEAIVWVVGHRIDDRFKVTDKTRRILKLKYVE